jgi:hypothetical protein
MAKVLGILKNNCIPLAIIMTIFAVILIVLWPKFGNIVSFDNSREVLVPYFINQGLVLYKEIMYVYGPLTPYLLAFLTQFIAFKIQVFLGFGICITLVIIIVLYFIARQVLSRVDATIVCLLFISQLMAFNSGMFSYIFPYTYAAIIGTLLVLIITLSLLLHYNNPSRDIYLWIASIACIITLMNKQDTAITSILTLFIYLFLLPARDYIELKGLSLKNRVIRYLQKLPFRLILKYFTIIVTITIMLYGLLGYNFGYSDYFGSIFLFSLLKNQAGIIFIRDECKGAFSIDNVVELISFAIVNLLIFITVIVAVYTGIRVFQGTAKKKKLLLLVIILFTLLLLLNIRLNNLPVALHIVNQVILHSKYIYSGVNLWLIGIIIYLFFKYKGGDRYFKMLFIGLVALLSNYRMFYNMQLEYYAFYYLPLTLIIVTFLCTKLIPAAGRKILPFLNVYKLRLSARIFLIITVIIYTLITIGVYQSKNIRFTSEFGPLYFKEQSKTRLEEIRKLTEIVNKQTDIHDKILLYPDYNWVYYTTKRLPASKYYVITIVSVLSKKEEMSIVEEIQKNKPQLIAVGYYPFPEYNMGCFGSQSFVPDIDRYIKDNYELIETIDQDEKIESGPYIQVYKFNY